MDPTKEICCTARNGQWETRNTEWHMFSKDALSQVSVVVFMSFYKTEVNGSILTLLMYLCKILNYLYFIKRYQHPLLDGKRLIHEWADCFQLTSQLTLNDSLVSQSDPVNNWLTCSWPWVCVRLMVRKVANAKF